MSKCVRERERDRKKGNRRMSEKISDNNQNSQVARILFIVRVKPFLIQQFPQSTILGLVLLLLLFLLLLLLLLLAWLVFLCQVEHH